MFDINYFPHPTLSVYTVACNFLYCYFNAVTAASWAKTGPGQTESARAIRLKLSKQ